MEIGISLNSPARASHARNLWWNIGRRGFSIIQSCLLIRVIFFLFFSPCPHLLYRFGRMLRGKIVWACVCVWMHVNVPVCVCVLLLSIQVENVPEEIIRTKDKVTFMCSFVRWFVCRFVSSKMPPHIHTADAEQVNGFAFHAMCNALQYFTVCLLLLFCYHFHLLCIVSFNYCQLFVWVSFVTASVERIVGAIHQPLTLSPPSPVTVIVVLLPCCCCRRAIAPLLIIRYCVLYLLICRNPLLPQNTKHCMDKWKQTESSK